MNQKMDMKVLNKQFADDLTKREKAAPDIEQEPVPADLCENGSLLPIKPPQFFKDKQRESKKDFIYPDKWYVHERLREKKETITESPLSRKEPTEKKRKTDRVPKKPVRPSISDLCVVDMYDFKDLTPSNRKNKRTTSSPNLSFKFTKLKRIDSNKKTKDLLDKRNSSKSLKKRSSMAIKSTIAALKRVTVSRKSTTNKSLLSADRPIWGKHVVKKKPDISPEERIKALLRQREEAKRLYAIPREDIRLDAIENLIKDTEGLNYYENEKDIERMRNVLE